MLEIDDGARDARPATEQHDRCIVAEAPRREAGDLVEGAFDDHFRLVRRRTAHDLDEPLDAELFAVVAANLDEAVRVHRERVAGGESRERGLPLPIDRRADRWAM